MSLWKLGAKKVNLAMKKLLYVFLAFTVVYTISCKKDDDKDNGSSPNSNSNNSNISSDGSLLIGKWELNYSCDYFKENVYDDPYERYYYPEDENLTETLEFFNDSSYVWLKEEIGYGIIHRKSGYFRYDKNGDIRMSDVWNNTHFAGYIAKSIENEMVMHGRDQDKYYYFSKIK